MMRYFLPAFIGILTLGIWEIWVTLANIPPFVLPAPTSIFDALLENANTLFSALTVTLYITTLAFFWAVISGIALAVIFTRARIIEMAFYPYVVTLQVTPVVAIAPLILIWVGFGNVDRALILIAWIVAFFPMLTNTVQGLRATDASLHELMTLTRAGKTETPTGATTKP